VSEHEQTNEQRQVNIEIDDSKVVGVYANFCRVIAMPEEMIIDFGLNQQPVGVPSSPIPVTQRVILNYYTAKRMLYPLQETIRRHEESYGTLEIDLRKRIKKAQEGEK
jgi:hypothetical protein